MFRGSRVEIVLQPKRFLFRPLELPARAADFLDGIVRAQIDRLTPWSASEAVFGCSAPVESGAESITTMIAATTRKVAMTYVQAVSSLSSRRGRGLHRCRRAQRGTGQGIRAEGARAPRRGASEPHAADRARRRRGGRAVRRDRRRPIWRIVSARRRPSWRSRFRSGAPPFAPAATAATARPIAALERRKHETPASVIVLEALSQLLPDHTYVTELHLAGNKLQIVGITRDAPSLIPLIEQSQHFTRATFYAPTTRSPSDPGERFHIEARVEPKNTASP